MLDADRARTDELEGIHIEWLHISSLGWGLGDIEVAVASEELGDDVLGMGFELSRAVGRQLELAGEDLVDTPAQCRPIALGDIEVSSQIEQGALTDFVADAFGVHEAVGEVGLAGGGGAGLGTADEHGREGSGGRRPVQYYKYILWHYISLWQRTINELREKISTICAQFPCIYAKNVKDGLGVPVNRITMILNGQRGVSADTALRLARYFGTTPQLWLNLQKTWELRLAEIETGHEITERVTPRQSVA